LKGSKLVNLNVWDLKMGQYTCYLISKGAPVKKYVLEHPVNKHIKTCLELKLYS
jgi:hypothetical protein